MGSFISAHSAFTHDNEDNENRICYTCSKEIDNNDFAIYVRYQSTTLRNNYTLCRDCDSCEILDTMYLDV
jgi:hypothetical protein